jgi:prepilin-type N-terminal cleavage/methylation domain-containing protein
MQEDRNQGIWESRNQGGSLESSNPGILESCSLRDGVTLLELLIVIMIIGLLTAAALKAYDTSLQAGRFQASARTLNELTAAIVGNPDLVTHGVRVDYGYVGDLGMVPQHLEDLVTMPTGIDPALWHGPYVTNRVAENPHGYMIDGWGDSLIYRVDSLTISSMRGMSYLEPDSWITRKVAKNQNVLLRNEVDGLVLDAKGYPPDSQDAANLQIALSYARDGYQRSDTVVPVSVTNGNFQFFGIPIGNHVVTVRWIDIIAPVETTLVQKTVSVAPGGKNHTDVHLPVPFW